MYLYMVEVQKHKMSPVLYKNCMKCVYMSQLCFCTPYQNEVTGLFMASQEGHLVVVQTLLEAGAGKAVNIARSTVSGVAFLFGKM